MSDEQIIRGAIDIFVDVCEWTRVNQMTNIDRDKRTDEEQAECDALIRATSDQWDKLFTYVFAHFPDPEMSDAEFYETKHKIIRSVDADNTPGGFYELCKLYPPAFLFTVLPIAFARCLLRNFWMPLNHRDAKTFKRFYELYSELILDDRH